MPDPLGRFTVTPLGPQDAAAYARVVKTSLSDLAETFLWAGSYYDPERRLAWVRSRPQAWVASQEYSFSVKHPETGKLVGVCSLNRIDWQNGTANLSFWTAVDARSHGAATIGAAAVVDFAFEKLGLHRVEILTSVGNEAAQKVARNVGAKREGVLTGRLVLKSGRSDGVLYAITKPEWMCPK